MYYSTNRETYSENYHGKDDHITPLVDKFYHDEPVEHCADLDRHDMGLHRHHHRQDLKDDAHRWSLGKISVLILVSLSLADIFIHLVDAQMESTESHDHYDALSADVIRPAFRYQGEYPRTSKSRPSMGLGSAAISSVTTTLSPILPFAGGIDLRREDYWSNGVFGSIYSVVEKVRDAFVESPTTNEAIRDVLAAPRGGSAVAHKGRAGHKSKPRKHSRSKHEEYLLSSPDCFIPLRDIADSTLKDVTLSFRYTLESTRREFNKSKFLSGILPRVRRMVETMSTATSLARGSGVVAPITDEGRGTGDIDALNFCATMRIFAEWRVLRQVPAGYKGYAVGIGLGQKDIVQNIAKIEHSIRDYLNLQDEHSDSDSITSNGTNAQQVLTSPTLRDLLQYEVDMGIQDSAKLPRLKEKSAAMGLLWVTRQLVYQTAIFENILKVPNNYDSSIEAVQAAYDDVYGDLHGWAIQKIFSYSFQAAPEETEIYKHMNPRRLEEVQQEARAKILGIAVPRKRKASNFFLSKLEHTPIGKLSRHVGNEWNKVACNVGNEWDKVTGNIGHEWDKVTSHVGQLFGHDHKPLDKRQPHWNDCSALNADPVDADLVSKELEIENFVCQEMKEDAYEHIRAYLEVIDPLLDDLTHLIDEFNMDDPTKV